ncbi:MAG: response regulator [Candidatus Electryonea clarkiae]|nr:response regulator [Candidatus Electryonea clarkiae]MDP8285818.1 response regulator [Candidatus Electryonea clarkiae]
MRILLIDNDSVSRENVGSILDVISAEVLFADDGKTGLDILATVEGKIDLILLEWLLPGMNGLEFLKTIKNDDRYKDIPVIMLTAVSDKERMIQAVRSGACQYIRKPFTNEELLTKIIQTHANGFQE